MVSRPLTPWQASQWGRSPAAAHLAQPGAAFWADRLLAVEEGDSGLGDLELGDRPVRLGQLVGLEGLDALGTSGIDQRPALPQ